MFLVLFIGLSLSLLTFTILKRVVAAPGWAALATLAFVCALPFLAGSNQVYSDLVAGIFILHATSLLVNALQDKSLSTMQRWILSSELAFLPWLYYRYLPPTLVLLLALVWIMYMFRRVGESTWMQFLPLVIVGCSFTALGVYNYSAFHNVLGMFRGNTVEYDVSKIAMIFLGLHLDSFQGMFLQQPLLWLALLGIVPFAFANGRAAALVGLGKVDPLRELQLGEVT